MRHLVKGCIRNASIADAARMLEIYSPHVLHSAVSFETVLPTVDEFALRISEITQKYPWIVYEVEGLVVGYAYASTYRTRCAYDWSCESSVYVDEKFHGRGIGKALYERLFQILKAEGLVNVFAGIALPNPASVGLHESMGFKQAGLYRNVGFKLDRWWDVGWWQLEIQRPDRPEPRSNGPAKNPG